MTQKEIEKAALLFAGAGEFGECPYNPDAKNGFMAGAQWRINSVWHDASEKPRLNKFFVFEKESNEWETDCIYQQLKWKRYVAEMDLIRWAYLDDLIPDGKEAAP